ncbi:MAG: YidC/Oxa1 family insertase periplasmic-domain containing protein, partial [Pirellulaceae bacterium]
AWLDTLPVEVAAGAEHKRKYLLFAGPKDPELLDRYGLGDLVYYGWFKWWAKPLSWILHTLYAIVRNYGIAIVLLTVLVRSLLFPLTRRASLNAQKMQTLQPEIKRINELYKNDFERRAKETRELYRKHNFNPASGCLPLFIQIPIMIGLYRAVSVDVQLRQQPLIPGFDWCSNLAGPDMLLNWSTWMPDWIAGKGTGWFGPYLNLLPIITVTLFIIQQKVLMPKATDEQQQMAQTMMMYMTIFMGVMFFKVPAGLCIYFITSSIWSLVERHMVKKFAPPAELALDAPAIGAAASRPLAARESASKKFDPAKIKSTKPPEKLSDVLPWLAKTKPPEEGTGRSGSPSRDAGSREQRRQRNGKKKT